MKYAKTERKNKMDKIAKIQYSYLHGAVDLFNAGTNDYYGSLSPKDGSTGAFANHFNYKVVLHAEDKKPIKIIAAELPPSRL